MNLNSNTFDLKKDDFIPRMPNCVFVNTEYRCYDNTQALINVMPRLRTYIDEYGNPKTFLGFLEIKNKKIKKDPILRGTTLVGGDFLNTHRPLFYTQPLGTELFYGNAFNRVERCNYVNGVPVCERDIRLPQTFSPNVHRFYYNMNIETC